MDCVIDIGGDESGWDALLDAAAYRALIAE